MSLQKAIAQWDGKSADYLSDVYRGYAHQSDFVAELIELTMQPGSQVGATWLLKLHSEQEGIVSPAQVNQIYGCLPQVTMWEAKLHILQSMPYLPIADSAKALVESFLRTCLDEKNKFVRAWIYNGWYELASQYPQYRAEAKQLLTRGMEEEAASVRARIRNIMKQGDLSDWAP